MNQNTDVNMIEGI